jgi:peroxiredoxin Q/BCP
MSEEESARVPQAGEAAPNFEMTDTDGNVVSLASLRGKTVILYFYPKDDTPGCTTEACGFRDAWMELREKGVLVYGVSPDDARAHAKFTRKYGLPFPLLSDPEGTVAKRYGVWVQKNMYGRQYMGNARTTFLIWPDGRIGHVWQQVKPEGHAQRILEYLASA